MTVALTDLVRQRLIEAHKRLESRGGVYPVSRLEEYYATFRAQFGPDILANLDGEALLTRMHSNDRDSLRYWLEYKDDDEMPAQFGSIAGGSALKFGIFRRKETGVWFTGSAQEMQELTLQQAIGIAETQRDQLLAGVRLLEKLPESSTDADYLQLQQSLKHEAPKVEDSAWGHKYFSLLFPKKLDDYHAPDYQRFHLITLMQAPPTAEGRYVAAGRYVELARELGWPINTLTAVLNELNPTPYRYWRVGTTDGDISYWDEMLTGSYMSIGWPTLGDLSIMAGDNAFRERIRAKLGEDYYQSDPQTAGRKAFEIYRFVTVMKAGDDVVAAVGAQILGVGRVTGPYSYNPTSPFPHTRPVEWIAVGKGKLPESQEGLQTSFFPITKVPNQIAVEGWRIDPSSFPPSPAQMPLPIKLPLAQSLTRLEGMPGRIQDLLERKGQIILYGPPGTGKTYWALRAARELAARNNFGKASADLSETEQTQLNHDYLSICTFHPVYGYEDFIEGYRPEEKEGKIVFTLKSGIFKAICSVAVQHPDRHYFLVIDEINRGDIPRIFGELLTLLEKDKRGDRGVSVRLPLSGVVFTVPDNVYLIGTMNTADRSIALLDTALRRRFGFVELMPDYMIFGASAIEGIPLGRWLKALNERICAFVGRDARNLQIGHSYLLKDGQPVRDLAAFLQVVRDEIIPQLQEYCYEDYAALQRILGQSFVDLEAQRIRDELFTGDPAKVIQALLAPCPELASSPEAINSEAMSLEEPPDELDIDDGTGSGEA